MVSVEHTLTPLGDVSRLLGATPDQVEQVAEKLALTLPLRLRGVLYFDADSIERIRLHLAASLSEPQQAILGALTNEFAAAAEIADRSGYSAATAARELPHLVRDSLAEYRAGAGYRRREGGSENPYDHLRH